MPTRTYSAVQSLDELKELVDGLGERGNVVSFDIETGYDGPDKSRGSLDPYTAFIVGFSLTDDLSWAKYTPIAHDFALNLDPDNTFTIIKPLLETARIIGHNAGCFERRFLRQEGIELNIFSDTIIEAHLMGIYERKSLKWLSQAVLGYKQKEITELFPGMTAKVQDCMRFNKLDVSKEVIDYACDDVTCALALHRRHYPEVKDKFLYRVEMQIQEIVCDMEDVGVPIDWEYLRDMAKMAESFMGKMHREILADLSGMVGRPVAINLNSSAQLSKVLYEQLGMSTTRVSQKSGNMSTDAVALEGLSKRYPVIKKILEWREVQALFKRYLQKWPTEFPGHDGWAHPSWNQCGVPTGRFSVNDPPVQQCPKKRRYELTTGEVWDLNFRNCVYAPDDYYLFDYDYSQVELRVLAGIAQEPILLQAFNNDEDVHIATAASLLGISTAEVTDLQRDMGKTMNYALMYGMQVKSLSERLAIPRDKAAQLYDAYFEGLAAVNHWAETAKREGKQLGYTISKFGRKFTIHEFQSSNPKIYAKGERLCLNAPIQGGAADYMKIAMVRVYKALKIKGLWMDKVKLILNNHDSLTFLVHKSISPREMQDIIKPAVEFAVDGFPKIVADFSYGPRWGSLIKESDWDKPDPEPSDQPVNDNERANLSNQREAYTAVADEIPTDFDTKNIFVKLDKMPGKSQFIAFCDFLDGRRGHNLVTLITPEGELPLESLTSIDVSNQAEISIIFGGAEVTQEVGELDVAEVSSGIDF